MKNLFIVFFMALVSYETMNAQTYGQNNNWGSTTEKTITHSSFGSSYSSGTNNSIKYQQGYFRDNGTYVRSHVKTRSNSTNWDNFSTSGNYNPFTGSEGSIARDYSSGAYNYGVGSTIQTGSRGGQYYINSNGNKTYVPKRKVSSSYPW